MTAENPSQITGKKLSARRNRESLINEQCAYLPSDTPYGIRERVGCESSRIPPRTVERPRIGPVP